MVLIHHSSALPAPGSDPSNPPQDPDMPSDHHLAKQQRKEERRRAAEREMRREAEEDRASVAREQLQNAEWIRSGGISFRMSPLPAFPELERAIEIQDYKPESIADHRRNTYPAQGAQSVWNSRAPSSRQEIESSVHFTGDHREIRRQPHRRAYRQEYLQGRAVHVGGTQRPQEYLHHIHHSLLKGPTPTPSLNSGPHHRVPRSTYGTDREQYGTLHGRQHGLSQLSATSPHNRPSSRDPFFERHNRDSAHRRGGLQGYTFKPDSRLSDAFSSGRSDNREQSLLRRHHRGYPHHGGLFDGSQNFHFARSDSRESHRRRQDRKSAYHDGFLEGDHDNHKSNDVQHPPSENLNTTFERLHIGLPPACQPFMAWNPDHPFPDTAPIQNNHTLQFAGPHGSRAHYAHVSLEPFDRYSNLSLAQRKADSTRQLRRSADPHHLLTTLDDHGSYDQSYLNDFHRPRREVAETSSHQDWAQGTGEYDGVGYTGSELDQYDSRGPPFEPWRYANESTIDYSPGQHSRHLATTSRGNSDGDLDLGSGSTVTLDGDEGSLTMADDYENVFAEENVRSRNEYTGRGRGNSWSEAKGRFGL